MEMKGEVTLPADRDTVWAKLNDPEVLKSCIAGVQSMERTSDTTFTASLKMKIGPVSATFKGNIELSNLDPPNGYRISGAGEGGIIPVGGVVANAVAAALSSLAVELRQLPLSPPRVWQMIRVAQSARGRAAR